MGRTYESIPFFSDEITIVPHSASQAEDLDRPVTVREFAAGKPCKLSRCIETGELTAETSFGFFIEGPEA